MENRSSGLNSRNGTDFPLPQLQRQQVQVLVRNTSPEPASSSVCTLLLEESLCGQSSVCSSLVSPRVQTPPFYEGSAHQDITFLKTW